jgi:hypothetical protein
MAASPPILTPSIKVIKLFSMYLTLRQNKLEHLYLAIPFQPSITFGGNTRSLPNKEASERCSTWVGPGLAHKLLDQTEKGCQGQVLYLNKPLCQ